MQKPSRRPREIDRKCEEGRLRNQEQRAQRFEDLHRGLGGSERSDFMSTIWPGSDRVRLKLSSTSSSVASLVIGRVRSSVPHRHGRKMFPFGPRSLPSRNHSNSSVARLFALPERLPPAVACNNCRRQAGRTLSGAPPPARRRLPYDRLPAADHEVGFTRLARTVSRGASARSNREPRRCSSCVDESPSIVVEQLALRQT